MRMPAASARRKAPTNVSVRADLVRQAKLSELLETALEKAIRDHERETWLETNREAIAGYNARVAKRGVFSDDWRRF
jgi:antitoxin CcdA